ncbi:hypothetical protein RJT34_04095 [Clitoria ternatea]|uniref:EKN n=1 Tax=Clitoria ternatea TaxID=43366 RepID=A0AAN9KP43_CLITE
MGNCGSNPKTNEGPETLPEPQPATEEVKVQHSNTDDTPDPSDSDNKSLASLLNKKVEEAHKREEVKAEPKAEEPKNEEVKVQEENPKTEEA